MTRTSIQRSQPRPKPTYSSCASRTARSSAASAPRARAAPSLTVRSHTGSAVSETPVDICTALIAHEPLVALSVVIFSVSAIVLARKRRGASASPVVGDETATVMRSGRSTPPSRPKYVPPCWW